MGRNWAFWQVALMSVGMIALWGIVTWTVYGLVNNAARGADHNLGINQVEECAGGARPT